MNSFISMNIFWTITTVYFLGNHNSNSNMISSVGRKLKKWHVHWFFMHCVFTNLISCQNTQNTMAWCGINGIWCTRKILIPEGVLQWVTVYMDPHWKCHLPRDHNTQQPRLIAAESRVKLISINIEKPRFYPLLYVHNQQLAGDRDQCKAD